MALFWQYIQTIIKFDIRLHIYLHIAIPARKLTGSRALLTNLEHFVLNRSYNSE
jgi:hypothetical protein